MPQFDPNRFSHIGGAQLAGTLHLWSYVATSDEDWRADDHFNGSSMRLGDWLLLTVQSDGDQCHGFLCVVAQIGPLRLAAVS